jgi:hypothetical protein
MNDREFFIQIERLCAEASDGLMIYRLTCALRAVVKRCGKRGIEALKAFADEEDALRTRAQQQRDRAELNAGAEEPERKLDSQKVDE